MSDCALVEGIPHLIVGSECESFCADKVSANFRSPLVVRRCDATFTGHLSNLENHCAFLQRDCRTGCLHERLLFSLSLNGQELGMPLSKGTVELNI